MPQCLMGGNEPFDPSGFLVDDIESVEITLCHSPAVPGARFRIVRSAGNIQQPLGLKLQMSAVRTNKYKQQVSGYVSIPWLEDWYGDVMDPDSIEHAAHSFLKNLSVGIVKGNGTGEEHTRFAHNAHVIESFVDKSGSVGGVPGGWWATVQVTDPDVWNKVLNKEYTGFSLGSTVCFVDTQNEAFKQSVFSAIPATLTNATPKEPAAGKPAAFINPGDYGFPTERGAYADPANNKFPIDTRSRAYATLRYVLQHYKEDGYDIDETKFMVRRMLAAIQAHGDSIPEAVLSRVGFSNSQSVSEFATEHGIKAQAAPKPNSKEDTQMSFTPEMLQQITTIVQDTVKQQTAGFAALAEKLNSAPNLTALLNNNQAQPASAEQTPAPATTPAAAPAPAQQMTPPATEPAPAEQTPAPAATPAPAQQTPPAEAPAEQPKQQSITDLAQAVAEALLQKQQSQQPKPVQNQQSAPVTAEDLQAALTQFGTTLMQGLMASNQNTVQAMQSVADRIGEMPMPRATMMRAMSHDQKSAFIESMRSKIQSGADLTRSEIELATSMGANFDADDPMASVGL